METKYFSMFTGVGGFELGFQGANDFAEEQRIQQGGNEEDMPNNKQESFPTKQFTCVGMSEIDKYANELLSKRFPNIKNYGDATKINPYNLPEFDMLCGGFPCQAFSIAGKRRGFNDTRGTMFFEIARILEVKRPKIVLLENVKGLLNHEGGETFRVILQTLDELGYEVQWMVLNSKFHGVPQNRERVFIIGSLRGERRPEILPFREGNQNANERGKQSSPTCNAITSRYHKGGAGTHLKYVGAIMSEKNKQWLKDGKEFSRNFPQGQRVYSSEGCSSTLAGNAGGLGGKTGLYAMRGRNPENPSDRTSGNPTEQRLELNKDGTTNTLSSVQKDNLFVENMKIRRLTPTECERLQGFPEGWTEGFSDTQRYKMMGNAVTVNVVRAIGERL